MKHMNSPIISVIVAVDENNAIGKDNKLLCHLPNDLKYFKSVTRGHTVIMGRNTYLSLPNGALPDRRNIVLSRNPDFKVKDAEVVRSLHEAVELCKDNDEVFVIGGGMLYNEAIHIAGRLYITFIHHSFVDTDTFFPKIDNSVWKEVMTKENEPDEKNKYSHSFIVYERINSIQ